MMQHSLEERVFSAYLRASFREAGLPGLNPLAPGVLRHAALDGLSYIILSTRDARIAAVYRVKQDGGLKRLRRWPKELA